MGKDVLTKLWKHGMMVLVEALSWNVTVGSEKGLSYLYGTSLLRRFQLGTPGIQCKGGNDDASIVDGFGRMLNVVLIFLSILLGPQPFCSSGVVI
jgi:hypothetical protein